MYVSEGKIAVYKNPQADSDTTGYVYFLDKVIIIDDGYGIFGWEKIVYPKKGFVDARFLMTEEEKKEHDIKFKYRDEENRNLEWTGVEKICPINYIFIKELKDESAPTIGLLSEGEKFLFIKDKLNGSGTWTKIIYPYEGYIKTEEMIKENNPILSIGFSYSAFNAPFEKNLKNYFNPIGGVIEYTKTNWNFSFGIGYTYSEARIALYYLKTSRISLEVKYKFFNLFNGKLQTYALAGGNYLFSSFQNFKYPSLTSTYYKKETVRTLAYSIGAGMIYNFSSFYIEAQYLFFNSKQAEFGSVPQQGEFGNYYKLYTGENHLSIIVGYKFLL